MVPSKNGETWFGEAFQVPKNPFEGPQALPRRIRGGPGAFPLSEKSYELKPWGASWGPQARPRSPESNFLVFRHDFGVISENCGNI